MFASSGSTGGRGRGGGGGGGDAKTIISPNTSFGDIIIRTILRKLAKRIKTAKFDPFRTFRTLKNDL